jgi:hypothetical protein
MPRRAVRKKHKQAHHRYTVITWHTWARKSRGGNPGSEHHVTPLLMARS